jgi:predicted site-specific integrase-resolvase
MTGNSWLTLEEAAQRLGVTKKIAKSLCEEGQLLGAEKKNGKWEVPINSTVLFEHRRQTMVLVPKKVLKEVKSNLLDYLNIVSKESVAIGDELIRRKTEAFRDDFTRNRIAVLTDQLERKQRQFASIWETVEWLSKVIV